MAENTTLVELLEVGEPETFRLKSEPTKVVHGKYVGMVNYCVLEEKFSDKERDKLAFENAPAGANAFLTGEIGFARGDKGQRTYFYKIEVPEKKAE